MDVRNVRQQTNVDVRLVSTAVSVIVSAPSEGHRSSTQENPHRGTREFKIFPREVAIAVHLLQDLILQSTSFFLRKALLQNLSCSPLSIQRYISGELLSYQSINFSPSLSPKAACNLRVAPSLGPLDLMRILSYREHLRLIHSKLD